MGNETAQVFVGLVDVAEVPGSVERVEAGDDQVRRVADVMQPCGGLKEVGVVAEDGREATSLTRDSLSV